MLGMVMTQSWLQGGNLNLTAAELDPVQKREVRLTSWKAEGTPFQSMFLSMLWFPATL